MLRSSVPLGRFFGVDVRLHISFLLLLALSAGWSAMALGSVLRGVALWLALMFAVVVREIARGLAAAYVGLDLRAVFLFPMGGVMALAPQPGGREPDVRGVTAVGPVANVVVGLLMLGTAYSFQPGIGLFVQPWITMTHILRSFVWLQFAMAIIGLFPAALPNRKLFARRGAETPKTVAGSTPPFHLGSMLGVAVALAGLATMNLWLVGLGGMVFLAAQINVSQAGGGAMGPVASTVSVGDVMLTDMVLLSSSDTLGGAMERTVHTLQDVFPVVRGDMLVGSVTRGTMAETMRTSGDGYVQGVMAKALHSAAPEEKLSVALERAAALGASEFIPVVEEDGRLAGIVTQASLTRAVHVMRVQAARQQQSARDDD